MQKLSYLLFTTVLLLSHLGHADFEERAFTRGYMIAVDTRDRAACAFAERRIQLIAPQTKQKICDVGGEFPIAVAVISLPTDEWDFTSEVSLAAKNKKAEILTKRVQGFARSGDSGIMFFLPAASDNDNILRLSVRKKDTQIAIMRAADFRILSAGDGISMSVSFILETLPKRFSSRLRNIADRLEDRMSIDGAHLDNKDQSVFAMMTLGLLGSTASTTSDESSTPGFAFSLFLPEVECPHTGMTTCAGKVDGGLFGTGILSGLGVAMTYRF